MMARQVFRGAAAVFGGALILLVGVSLALAEATSPPAPAPATSPATAPATTPATTQAAVKEYAATDTEALKKAAAASETVVVTGRVAKVDLSGSGKICRLRFEGASERGNFIVAYFPKLFPAMQKKFGGPNGVELAGKNIRVRGQVKNFKGDPEMVLDRADQIEVVK